MSEERIIRDVEITDAGSEGMAIGKSGDKVIFIPFVVPGDIVDVKVIRRKKRYLEGRAVHFHQYSALREEPFCSHYGTCGGCKWQGMKYGNQLFYKQKQVEDNFRRIGKFTFPALLPIVGADKTTHYRNKIEFAFSNRRWLTEDEIKNKDISFNAYALGFHVPTFFDRVIDIHTCYLQADPSNEMRNFLRKYALEHSLSFYDARNWTGLMRNVFFRNTSAGEWMVIVVFGYDDKEVIHRLLGEFQQHFPEVSSLYYIINGKKNDTISDLDPILFAGNAMITETLTYDEETKNPVRIRIGPLSFFQTNTLQAGKLFSIARKFASIQPHELVYDLYTGAGSIACYVSGDARMVVGVESVAAAIEDAKENARLNGIRNTRFFTGEAERILNPDFTTTQGSPDVIITDPPRAGMHARVVETILSLSPSRIVYVSCNPATQARDISLLADGYEVTKVQPVDMFPHTQHVENVVLLIKKN